MRLPNADHLQPSLPFSSIDIPVKQRWQGSAYTFSVDVYYLIIVLFC